MENGTIGQRISQRRKLLQLSQEALGDRLGVSRQAVSKWESDGAIPEIDNLVTMSRIFGVSVDWLLGIEVPPQPQPEEPKAPWWRRNQKWLLAGIAVCCAGCLILSGASLIRQWNQKRKLEEQMAAFQSYLTTQFQDQNFLGSYDFACTPWLEFDGAELTFTAVPYSFLEGTVCELEVYLEEELVTTRECTWDGSAYTAQVSLEAADGYRFLAVLRGNLAGEEMLAYSFRQNVSTEAMSHLCKSLSPATVSAEVTVEPEAGEAGTLNLENLHVQVRLPSAFDHTPDLWSRCDLVLLCGGSEIGRIDLLNRSDYSAQVDFSGADVDFTTRWQTFDLPDTVGQGDELTLKLECGLSTGHSFSQEVRRWTWMGE